MVFGFVYAQINACLDSKKICNSLEIYVDITWEYCIQGKVQQL